MSRLEHRIERDLRQIAERATPSPDAWSSILTRISDQVLDDVPVPDTWSFTEEEVTMIDFGIAAPTDGRRKAPKRVLVAGLLAAAAVVGIVIMSSRDANDSTPTDEPSPTVTVPPAPPPRALGTTGDLVPGTYFVDEVNGRPTARIFFTIGAGWEAMTDTGIGQFAESPSAPTLDSAGWIRFDLPVAVFSDACHTKEGYHPGPVTSLDGLVAALSEQQGWAEVTAPSDISIDGYVGKAFQRTTPADMVYNCDLRSGHIGERIPDGVPGFPDFRSWESPGPEGRRGGAGAWYEPGETETLWILDLDGTVVVITAKMFPEASAVDHAEFAAVLDSIRIERA